MRLRRCPERLKRLQQTHFLQFIHERAGGQKEVEMGHFQLDATHLFGELALLQVFGGLDQIHLRELPQTVECLCLFKSGFRDPSGGALNL